MFTKVHFFGALALCVVAISLSGCRNRCNPCGAPYQQQPIPNYYGNNAAAGYAAPGYAPAGYAAPGYAVPNAVAGRSPVIPPPATGTLNIPSLARNNPFGINPNRGLINTQQPAPTAARSARFNRQNGWQPVGTGNTRPSTNQSNVGQPSGNTTLGSNSNFNNGQRQVAPAAARSVLVQDTQSRANQGYGDSYVRSPNYSTTAVNETFDRTRLPATDASAVRAPSQYYARASGVQVARAPGQGLVGAQPNYYSGTFQAQNPAAYNVTPGVFQSGVFRPGVAPTGVIASRSNVIVQDQSTASYDPYGDTRSADWRNRDVSSGTFQ